MQSVVEVKHLEVAARSAARQSKRSRSLFQALRGTMRRVVRLDFFGLEDEIGRAIDRAFAEFAHEMRK
jgi:hypothetical protein